MAVHTPVNETELRGFLRLYDVGVLIRYYGIAEGVENSNFYVETTKDEYIVTLYEQRVKEADLPFYMRLMQFLAQKGIKCPQPVLRRDGVPFGHLAGRPAAQVSFLPGAAVMQPEAEHCAALGAALAELHKAGRDFPLRRRNALAQADWLPLWRKCRKKAAEFADEMGEKSDFQAEIDEELAVFAQAWPRDLPQGIIHADLFPDNVLFQGQAVSGLIDFYFACSDSLAYDVAICLNAWCFEQDCTYNAAKGAALLQAYHRLRPLGQAEIAHLPLLARGAAMRFFLTRFYDWFHTPEGSQVMKKPPQEYIRKLRFLRDVKSSAELGLRL